MDIYEHKAKHIDRDRDAPCESEVLEEMGRKGWELVAVVKTDGPFYSRTLYFKRKKL